MAMPSLRLELALIPPSVLEEVGPSTGLVGVCAEFAVVVVAAIHPQIPASAVDAVVDPFSGVDVAFGPHVSASTRLQVIAPLSFVLQRVSLSRRSRSKVVAVGLNPLEYR